MSAPGIGVSQPLTGISGRLGLVDSCLKLLTVRVQIGQSELSWFTVHGSTFHNIVHTELRLSTHMSASSSMALP